MPDPTSGIPPRAGWPTALLLLLAACGDKDKPSPTEAAPVCPSAAPTACFERGMSLLGFQPKAAVEALRRACDQGHGAGCNNLAQQWEDGDGVAKNLVEASAHYEKACQYKSPEGCANLSRLLRRQRPEDKAASYAADDAGCQLGHAECCYRVGNARAQGLGTAEDKKAAMAAWSKSCAKGYERACAVTGLNLVLGIDDIKKDAEVGVELLQGACRASVAEACKDLGGLHLGGMVPDADRTEGVQRLTEACDLGYGEGCNELGVAYAQGLGVERADAAMAVRLFDRACRLGADNGCSNFGLALSQGVGVERDLKRAHKLFHAACHRGHQASCEHHQKLADEH